MITLLKRATELANVSALTTEVSINSLSIPLGKTYCLTGTHDAMISLANHIAQIVQGIRGTVIVTDDCNLSIQLDAPYILKGTFAEMQHLSNRILEAVHSWAETFRVDS
jgi:hypothetical protein